MMNCGYTEKLEKKLRQTDDMDDDVSTEDESGNEKPPIHPPVEEGEVQKEDKGDEATSPQKGLTPVGRKLQDQEALPTPVNSTKAAKNRGPGEELKKPKNKPGGKSPAKPKRTTPRKAGGGQKRTRDRTPGWYNCCGAVT